MFAGLLGRPDKGIAIEQVSLLWAALSEDALQYVWNLELGCSHIRFDSGYAIHIEHRRNLFLCALPWERDRKQNDVQHIDDICLCFIKQSVGYLFASLYNLDY